MKHGLNNEFIANFTRQAYRPHRTPFEAAREPYT